MTAFDHTPLAAALPYQTSQLAFSHWLRQPTTATLPMGIEARRMQVYRDLVFNNIESFLAHSYPIAIAMLPEDDWDFLVAVFFQYGQCDSPYYYDISMHFRDFLDQHMAETDAATLNGRDVTPNIRAIALRAPWLRELLHYEWMALYVDMAETNWQPRVAERDDALTLRTSCWVLGYQYAVHTWSVDEHPAEPSPQPTCLLIYRTSDFQTRAYPIHALWAYLIELIQSDAAHSPETLVTALITVSALSPELATKNIAELITWLSGIDLL